VTSGAASDIDYATKLARAMVTRWGLSDKLGPLAYSENQEEVFLGHSVSRTQNISDETAKTIDEEIRRIVDEGYNAARKILTEKTEDLHKIAKSLLEFETLSGEEIKAVLRGERIVRETPPDDNAKPAPTSVPGVSRPPSGLSPEPQPG
jgi:cell division protease FtsH